MKMVSVNEPVAFIYLNICQWQIIQNQELMFTFAPHFYLTISKVVGEVSSYILINRLWTDTVLIGKPFSTSRATCSSSVTVNKSMRWRTYVKTDGHADRLVVG